MELDDAAMVEVEVVSLVVVVLSVVEVSSLVVEPAGAAVLILVVAEDMLVAEAVVDDASPLPTSFPQRKVVTVPKNIWPMTVSLPARSP